MPPLDSRAVQARPVLVWAVTFADRGQAFTNIAPRFLWGNVREH